MNVFHILQDPLCITVIKIFYCKTQLPEISNLCYTFAGTMPIYPTPQKAAMGDTCWETLKSYNGKVFLQEHKVSGKGLVQALPSRSNLVETFLSLPSYAWQPVALLTDIKDTVVRVGKMGVATYDSVARPMWDNRVLRFRVIAPQSICICQNVIQSGSHPCQAQLAFYDLAGSHLLPEAITLYQQLCKEYDEERYFIRPRSQPTSVPKSETTADTLSPQQLPETAILAKEMVSETVSYALCPEELSDEKLSEPARIAAEFVRAEHTHGVTEGPIGH